MCAFFVALSPMGMHFQSATRDVSLSVQLDTHTHTQAHTNTHTWPTRVYGRQSTTPLGPSKRASQSLSFGPRRSGEIVSGPKGWDSLS